MVICDFENLRINPITDLRYKLVGDNISSNFPFLHSSQQLRIEALLVQVVQPYTKTNKHRRAHSHICN